MRPWEIRTRIDDDCFVTVDPRDGAVSQLMQVAELAQRAGRARFSMQSQIGDDDDDPHVYTGVVDLQSGAYSSDTRCFVDGIHYGRESPADPWTSLPWDEGHLPISPLWLILILHGAQNAASSIDQARSAESLRATCDLRQARRATGLVLAGVNGDRNASVSVQLTTDSHSGRPREITARLEDLIFTCEFWDYGTGATIEAPRSSKSLADVSPLQRKIARVPIAGTLFFMARAARLKRLDTRSGRVGGDRQA